MTHPSAAAIVREANYATSQHWNPAAHVSHTFGIPARQYGPNHLVADGHDLARGTNSGWYETRHPAIVPAEEVERAVNAYVAYVAAGRNVDAVSFLAAAGIQVESVAPDVIVTRQGTVRAGGNGGWYVEPAQDSAANKRHAWNRLTGGGE